MDYILYYGKDYGKGLSNDVTIILNPEEVDENIHNEYDIKEKSNFIYSRTHEDGWTIKAKICKDYCAWIEEFEARHDKYGTIKANLHKEIVCESKKAYNHFIKHHPLREFCYGDI